MPLDIDIDSDMAVSIIGLHGIRNLLLLDLGTYYFLHYDVSGPSGLPGPEQPDHQVTSFSSANRASRLLIRYSEFGYLVAVLKNQRPYIDSK